MKDAVLVTGGAGYIGAHVAKALAGAGYLPVTLDNLVYGHRAFVRWGPLIEADIGDRQAVEAALREHKIAAVIHLAGFTFVGESVRDPLRYYDNNTARAVALLHAMQACGVKRIVFSSTAAVYGNPQRTPIDEEHPTAPINPYGASKLMVERILADTGAASGLGWMALRYFNASGADPDGELGEEHEPETHLIPLAIRAALGTGPALSVFGTDYDTPDGTAVRDYIHVGDLAAAHVRALERLEAGGASGALNLGIGRGYSVREVIGAVAAVGGCKVPHGDAPRRAGDPPVLVADPGRAKQALGWTPAFTRIEAIVRTAWAWHSRAGT